jgi:hypothetical protein
MIRRTSDREEDEDESSESEPPGRGGNDRAARKGAREAAPLQAQPSQESRIRMRDLLLLCTCMCTSEKAVVIDRGQDPEIQKRDVGEADSREG